jgi:hypothetical protein
VCVVSTPRHPRSWCRSRHALLCRVGYDGPVSRAALGRGFESGLFRRPAYRSKRYCPSAAARLLATAAPRGRPPGFARACHRTEAVRSAAARPSVPCEAQGQASHEPRRLRPPGRNRAAVMPAGPKTGTRWTAIDSGSKPEPGSPPFRRPKPSAEVRSRARHPKAPCRGPDRRTSRRAPVRQPVSDRGRSAIPVPARGHSLPWSPLRRCRLARWISAASGSVRRPRAP